jgi:hypothetical protein
LPPFSKLARWLIESYIKIDGVYSPRCPYE